MMALEGVGQGRQIAETRRARDFCHLPLTKVGTEVVPPM
jgi:hypothetical protein